MMPNEGGDDFIAPLPFMIAAGDALEVKKKLTPSDMVWAKLQPWLLERGYKLRPRYQPEWKASWAAESFAGDAWKCEDYQTHTHAWVMDAVRVRDGALVMMKRVGRSTEGSEEVQLAQLLSDKSMASDSNHCVPIYEVLDIPEAEHEVLVVMPLLYIYLLQPPFETVGEIVDFFKQSIEGMLFMHQHNIAFCDCKHDNILADTAALYDEPPHPILLESSYDGQRTIKQRYTRTTKPVKYYYIDFGLSNRYQSRNGNFKPAPWGAPLYKVPEFQQVALDTPTDPFPVDVYMLGMMFRQRFLEVTKYNQQRDNLEWMTQLARDMTLDDPKSRPTIEEVMTRFSVLVKKLGPWKLRAPVSRSDYPLSFTEKTRHWITQISRMARLIPAIPSPARIRNTG